MQRWVCPNCSQANAMCEGQCAKCRFEPVGLDVPPAMQRGALSQNPPSPDWAPPSVVDVALFVPVACLLAWLAWMAVTLPSPAREPFALFLLTCVGIGAWVSRQGRRTRRA